MDSTDLAGARIERFLETEPVVWLSTTGADGAPHLVPTWFAWDGDAIVIRSKPGARKVRNLRADARAMLALGDADDDFDVGLLEATAVVHSRLGVATDLPAEFVDKYRTRIAALGLTVGEFARTYSATIRLVPDRAIGWHGRTQPASIASAARRVAGARPVTIAEPRRAHHVPSGEPIARRRPDRTWRGLAAIRAAVAAAFAGSRVLATPRVDGLAQQAF